MPSAPQVPPRRWQTWQIVAGVIVVLFIGIGVGSAMSSKNKGSKSSADSPLVTTGTAADGTPTVVTEAPTIATVPVTAPPTTAAPKGSSRALALPLGTSATVGNWTVTVATFQADASAEVAAANQFNDPPPPGQAYSLIHLRAVYNGEGSGDANFDLSANFVGSDARAYSDSDCSAVVPNDMSDEPSVFKGGQVEGNFCVKGPAPVTSGPGAISIDASSSFDSVPTWWSTK